MKKLVALLLVIIPTFAIQAQEEIKTVNTDPKAVVSVGILHGASFIGADFEYGVSERFGVQAGLGLVGFGAGVNYHLKPGLRSSMVSAKYWHMGVEKDFSMEMISADWTYRARKWFTVSVGLGVPTRVGADVEEEMDTEVPAIMLTYSIGAYIPWGKK